MYAEQRKRSKTREDGVNATETCRVSDGKSRERCTLEGRANAVVCETLQHAMTKKCRINESLIFE